MQPPPFLALIALAASTTVVSYLVGRLFFWWFEKGPSLESLSLGDLRDLHRRGAAGGRRGPACGGPSGRGGETPASQGGNSFERVALPYRDGAGSHLVMDCRLCLN